MMQEKEQILQILREVQDDENFKAFYSRFEELRIDAEG